MDIRIKYIEKKILNTKKNIYLNAKKCNQKNFAINKKKLVLDRENFLVFIKKVVNELLHKYNFKKSYLQKLVTCVYCLIHKPLEKIHFITYLIKQKIEQYIINIILHSFFHAKLGNNLISYDRIKSSNLDKKWIKILKHYKIPGISFNDISRIIYKNYKKNLAYYLFDLPQENRQISHWFRQNNLAYLDFQDLNNIHYILDQMRLIGQTWSIYNCIVNRSINNIEYFLNGRKVIKYIISQINCSQSSIIFSYFASDIGYSLANTYHYLDYKLQLKYTPKLFIFYLIRHLLYKKNYQNRWKMRKDLNINKVKIILIQILTKLYEEFDHSLSIYNIDCINSKIDHILYIWQIKK